MALNVHVNVSADFYEKDGVSESKMGRSRTLRSIDQYFLVLCRLTVLCKSNANVCCRNSRLFLAFQRKNIEFSMAAHFQRKVTVIRDAYCFQLREFSNNNLLVTKIDFEFSSENSLYLINESDH